MKKIIFVGPSISPSMRTKFSSERNVFLYPPAEAGDIWKILGKVKNISHILIIDGYFFTKLSILHREILSALNQNIKVVGAASLGALRAIELLDYGMIGHGEVFKYFKEFPLTGDDEVGILHSEDTDYKDLTIPLINLRLLLYKNFVKNEYFVNYLSLLIKKLEIVGFWKRTWKYIEYLTKKEFPTGYLDCFKILRENYIDFKSEDAKSAINYLIKNKFKFNMHHVKKSHIKNNGIDNSFKKLNFTKFINSEKNKDLDINSFISILRLNSYFSENDIAIGLFKKMIIDEYSDQIIIDKASIKKERKKLVNVFGCDELNSLNFKVGLSEEDVEKIIKDKLIFSKYIKYKTDELGLDITNEILFESFLSTINFTKYDSLKEIYKKKDLEDLANTCIELNNKLGSALSLQYFFLKTKKNILDIWQNYLITRYDDLLFLIDKVISTKKK